MLTSEGHFRWYLTGSLRDGVIDFPKITWCFDSQGEAVKKLV